MRGATHQMGVDTPALGISIHAPHAGRDVLGQRGDAIHDGFQSTRPMRGATEFPRRPAGTHPISIHAPHAGRDKKQHKQSYGGIISIHAPHAGRDT